MQQTKMRENKASQGGTKTTVAQRRTAHRNPRGKLIFQFSFFLNIDLTEKSNFRLNMNELSSHTVLINHVRNQARPVSLIAF